VKRLFRTRFQLELSETALGYTRLFDLLQDAYFRSVCTLEAHKNGQLLVKRAQGSYQLPCHQLMAPASDMWSMVYWGSFQYPATALETTTPPTLSVLKQGHLDLGMEQCWHGALSSEGVLAKDPSDVYASKGRDDDSGYSTEFRSCRDFVSSSSDEGVLRSSLSPLAVQAEELRVEEEENLQASCRASRVAAEEKCSHTSLARAFNLGCKNTFIEVPLFFACCGANPHRRSCSVPRDMSYGRTQ